MSVSKEQKAVVDNDGNTMVIAIAGSGKTHTIIHRCEKILTFHPHKHIAMVTFTRAAATEMADRLAKKGLKRQVKANTFHAFALQQIRQGKTKVKLAPPGMIPGYIYKALNQTQLAGYPYEYEELSAGIDHYNNMLVPSNDGEPLWELFVEYKSILKAKGEMDFGDLSRVCIEGMRSGKIVTLPVDYLFIDEFQDSDEIQYTWMMEHIKAGIEVTIVGDDDQSIYGWRGGMGAEGFARFQRDTQARAYRLTTNYRCAEHVLRHADNLINFNKIRIDKTMVSGKGIKGTVEYMPFLNSTQEFDALVDYLREDHKGEWGILARNNQTLDKLQLLVNAAGISVTRLGGKSIWERPAVTLYLGLISAICQGRIVGITHMLAWLGVKNKEIERFSHYVSQQGGIAFTSIEAGSSYCHSIQRLLESSKLWRSLYLSEQYEEMCNDVFKWVSEQKNASNELKLMGVVAKLLPKMYPSMSLDMKLDRLREYLRQSKEPVTSRVTLATMHSSKGLEFQNVWIVSANAGTIPSAKSPEEEERRLMYVAMTRAEERLIVSHTEKPSRFVTEAANPELIKEKVELTA